MLNTPEAYFEAGSQTATARLQKDEARARFHRDWFSRARGLEKAEDRTTAQRHFDEGYAAVQPVRRTLYLCNRAAQQALPYPRLSRGIYD